MTEEQERTLRTGLAALAATSRSMSASPRVEQAVLEEMRRVAPAPRSSMRWMPLAAALLLACGSGVWLAQRTPELPALVEPSPFVELPGAAVMPPFESGSIVRVSLPVTTLPSYGIQIVPDIGRGPVTAELLVAQDGYPRAIRLVRNSDSSRSRP